MSEITQEYLHEILTYYPESGLFFWNKSTSTKIKVGQQAGGIDPNGYVRIRINRRKYQAHRLAWLYVHGVLPPKDTEHINRVRKDNRIINLRPATRSENKRNTGGAYANNKSGLKGVSQRANGKWRAQYWDGSRNVNIGQFDTAEDASRAYSTFIPAPMVQTQESLL